MKDTIQSSLISSVFYTVISVGSFVAKFLLGLLQNPPEVKEEKEIIIYDEKTGEETGRLPVSW